MAGPRVNRRAVTGSGADRLLEKVDRMMARNRELEAEVQALRALVAGIERSLAGKPTPARPAVRAAAAAADPEPPRRKAKAKYRRKPITDPAAIEKRRAALAKARAAQAAKRASARG